jgi:enoyl-CoA hydratase/carnithine racemase
MSSGETSEALPLLVAQDGGVVRLTLNRPRRRNALSRELVGILDAELLRIGADSTARVVVLRANGPVFCSGHDLTEMSGLDHETYTDLFRSCSQMMQRLRQIPQPVIAQVQGVATAAGCQLVAACDLAVATDESTFATPGVRIGLFCATPMVPLVRSMSPKVAMEMLLTGEPISARRAVETGLINSAVPTSGLEAEIDRIVRAILATSPYTIRLGKAAFYDQMSLPEPEAYRQAVEVISQNAIAHDAQEGISAFLAKRSPQWTGE